MRELLARLREHGDLEAAIAVLGWDQATYMPPGGAEARGRQLATLERIAHEKLTDPAVPRLLEKLAGRERAIARGFLRCQPHPGRPVATTNVPAVFRPSSSASGPTTSPRPTTFGRAPAPPTISAQSTPARENARSEPPYASYFPGAAHMADPLIDQADPGMTTKTVRALFAELREKLVPIVQAIASQPSTDDRCLRADLPGSRPARFRPPGHRKARIRLRARPPRQDAPPRS